MLIPINTLSNFPELSFALAGYPEEIVTSFNGWTVGFRHESKAVVNSQVAAGQSFAAGQGVNPHRILKGGPTKNCNFLTINKYYHTQIFFR